MIIGKGAEAIIYLKEDHYLERENNILNKKVIIKERIPKNYRHQELDIKLRLERTRREAKIINDAAKLIPVPKLIKTTEFSITMEYIEGPQLKEIIEENPFLAEIIGKQLAVLHDNNIIHNDLTTSNMIFADNKIFFIDFGLSFKSRRIEDKAVDIHLFKQALESKHYLHFNKLYSIFLKGYSQSKNYDAVLNRLKEVEKRGRYKRKKL